MNFVTACNVADVQPGSSVQATGGSEPIAVFNVNGRFFATQDRCPHGQWSLAESYLVGDTVECALHNGRFSVSSGKRLSPPVCRALRTYAVKVEAGLVYVDVDSGAYELRAGATTSADVAGSAHELG
ncbi:MAG: non-heme iron oxygenase ferredoxin subunit [Gammaproteobacteria bacterium]